MKKLLLLLVALISIMATAQITVGPIPDYVLCDDPSNDDIEVFTLSTLDVLAIGNQNPNALEVSYHASQFDAVNDLNELNTSSYTNTTNPQTIFVRVEEIATGNFNIGLTSLIVEALPIINNPQVYTYCGQVTPTGQVQVDLFEIEPFLANGQNNILFTYFLSQQDAVANTNPLSTTFVADANIPIDLFIRAQTTNNCFEVITVTIILTPCNQTNPLQDLVECENSNNQTCFDLNQNTLAALGNNSPNTHVVTYHLSQSDADNNLNPLQPTYCVQQTTLIFVRVEEIATGTADTTQQFNLVVNEVPPLYSFSDIVACDLGFPTIDWQSSSVLNEITGVPNNVNGFNVAYYATQSDVDNQINPIGFVANFTTPSTATQVFVGVTFQPTGCYGVSPLNLVLDPNCFFIGQPNSLEACDDGSGQACFDLTQNDPLLIANNNPANLQITYHTTFADAINGMNPIATPANYCVFQSQAVYARVFNTVSGNYETTSFDVVISDAFISTQVLSEVQGCDDDFDGIVSLDLTSANSQFPPSALLEYYENLQDALAEVNAISTPSSYDVQVGGFSNFVYLRETISASCDSIYELPYSALSNCNNSYLCANAQSLCNRISQPFPNIADNSNAEPGNYYPFSQSNGPRNPSWFYIPIESSGVVELELYQNTQPDFMGQDLDIDFVIYGPFTTPTGGCAAGITQANYVDHSFSVQMPEIGTIPNAQAGEYYLILTSNFSNQPGFLKFELGANTTATINCDGIRLNAFMDTNANGVVDASDIPFPLGSFNYEKNASGNVMNVVAPTGSYTIFDTDATATYDVGYDVLPAYTANYTVAPASYTGLSIPSGSGVVDYDFLMTPVVAYEDVIVYILPQEQPRPGFTYTETVVYANLGTSPVPVGQLQFTYDPLVSIVAVDDPAAVINPSSVDLAYTNLLPFEYRTMEIEMQVPVIPTVALGDILTNTATIAPVANDITPANNTSVSSQVIIGSYDPNDKMESRGPSIIPAEFTSQDYLYYTIRFENTGTASAINVRIEDTLDPLLDWSTLEMIDASHPYVMTRMEDQVVWRFDNIMLPDSTTDPVGANGHVYFKIKPTTFTEGTTIPNTAEIYFDFNPPIITNTFVTTFETPLSIDTPDVAELVIMPNPASSFIKVELSNATLENASFILYDMQGRITLSRKLTSQNSRVDINELPAGIYLAELRQGDEVFTTKIIKE